MISRIGWFMCKRLANRIALVVGVFFGIILLVEFLDTWRFVQTAELSHPLVAVGLSFVSAVRWSLLGLPVTVLIGAIVGLIDLQSHREMVIVSATGRSIWTILQWPLAMIVVAGIILALVVDGLATRAYQELDAAQIGWGRAYGAQNRDTWLQQTGADGDYVLYARSVLQNGTELRDVTVFRLQPEGAGGARLFAEVARFGGGQWTLENGRALSLDRPVEGFAALTLATTSTRAELNLTLGSVEDLSYFELLHALDTGIADPFARAAAETRFQKLTALPLVLVGSLLIAFAFTAGYRRQGHYGRTILYGIVLGLVVFVITEMADQAGSAGVLDPVFAAWGPAAVAIIIGVTVLLYREDGRKL